MLSRMLPTLCRVVIVGLLVAQGALSYRTCQIRAGQQAGTRKTSTPYSGNLSIFESPGRDERLQINRVMDILGIAPGKNVADIGAGSGWFTVRAARRIAPRGTVYAADLNPESIKYVQ